MVNIKNTILYTIFFTYSLCAMEIATQPKWVTKAITSIDSNITLIQQQIIKLENEKKNNNSNKEWYTTKINERYKSLEKMKSDKEEIIKSDQKLAAKKNIIDGEEKNRKYIDNLNELKYKKEIQQIQLNLKKQNAQVDENLKKELKKIEEKKYAFFNFIIVAILLSIPIYTLYTMFMQALR